MDMEIQRTNVLEHLDLDLEWDSAHDDQPDVEGLAEVIEAGKLHKIILCGSSEAGGVEGASYLWVDVDYSLEMSVGQLELYRLLRDSRDCVNTAVLNVTTVEKLTKALKLRHTCSVIARLGNLQSIGAISGFRY